MADGSLSPSLPASNAPSRPVDLRPLTTSELIDRGFSLYRAHFTGFFLLALLCQIAPLLSQILIAALDLNPTLNDVNAPLNSIFYKSFPVLLILLVTQFIVFCFEVIITFFVADAYLGRTPSVTGSMRRFAGCVVPSIRTYLLYIFLLTGSLLFPLLAGGALFLYRCYYPPEEALAVILYAVAVLMLFVVSLIPLLWVFMRLMVTIPVMALEGKGGWKAVRRSFEIVGYHPNLGMLYWGAMRLSFLLLPLFAIELLVFSITSLPLIIHKIGEVFHGGAGGRFFSPADVTVVISQVLTFLAISLILPLYTIATTLFYYDVRIRREGFDLEFMAEKLEGRS